VRADSDGVVIATGGDGRWFPADPDRLRGDINDYMEGATLAADLDGRIVAAIAPHAGYIYSGPVAGYTFRAIRDSARAGFAPDCVIVLGFGHHRASEGVALLQAEHLTSPAGSSRMDRDAAALLTQGRARIQMDSAPHHGEHSAENMVPFVQMALPETPLVVGIVGDHAPATLRELGEGLGELASTRNVLVIASTDLLHDPDYDRVGRSDRKTLQHITAMDSEVLAASWDYQHQVCCGIAPVLVTIDYARRQGCRAGTLLHYRNSGDDHPEGRGQWVVGYGAVVFTAATR